MLTLLLSVLLDDGGFATAAAAAASPSSSSSSVLLAPPDALVWPLPTHCARRALVGDEPSAIVLAPESFIVTATVDTPVLTAALQRYAPKVIFPAPATVSQAAGPPYPRPPPLPPPAPNHHQQPKN
eukprot:COSAG01_NODE_35567_length_529_cov_0.798144_1_plen_126_part_00